MRIFYLSNHSVYIPGANSNRLLCISKGLIKLGHEVNIMHTAVIDPTKYTIDKNIYGKVITFNYKKKVNTKYGRLIFSIFSFFTACKSYIWLSKQAKISKIYVISVDTLFLNKLIYYLLYLNRRIVLIKEVVEFPLHEIRKLSTMKNLYYRFNYYLEFRIFKAYMPISSALDRYIKSKSSKYKTEIIPICVELERFSNIKVSHKYLKPYIAYCGDMSNDKDGVGILLDVFENIYKTHPDYNLVLIGTGFGFYYDSILNKRIFLKSKENIHFVGNVSREEIPDYLQNADVLVLTRPLNKQTEGGLPTKLGEYLATGNPVVVSDVSDIKSYLEPRNAAYICEPDSISDATNKILEAIENNSLSAIIGANGRKAAEELFSEIKVSEKIVSFLKNISNDR